MSDGLQYRTVTTRKDHNCGWCDEIIRKGEHARYCKCVDSGIFARFYLHLECDKAMDDTANWVTEDGWMPGDFKRGVASVGY